jgi:hypothetical protein
MTIHPLAAKPAPKDVLVDSYNLRVAALDSLLNLTYQQFAFMLFIGGLYSLWCSMAAG